MNKNIKINISLVLLISVSPLSLQAIQSSTANICTLLLASLCAGGSYKIVQDAPVKIYPGVLIGASCVMTAVAYYVLHQATPAGRIKRANLLLNDIYRHTLARTHFDNDQSFFDAVQDVYLTDDLPLISAYNHLIDLLPRVRYALGLINKASAEVNRDVLLQEECDASLSCANKLFKNISDAIKRIRDHKDYLSQLTIYKESLHQTQQTIAQQQMANAQQDAAHAKQSSTFLKWLKFLLGY
ncbi:MAG TPA: hypothetical protein VKR54_05140 [Candidatus Babeliales bacterium]|jgi:hypothetical protein|nr:hypothetical protein [Candidatus Babeliales bacterium]